MEAIFLEFLRLLMYLWGVSLLHLFCFMKEYPYIWELQRNAKSSLSKGVDFWAMGWVFLCQTHELIITRDGSFWILSLGWCCCYDGQVIMFLMLQMTQGFVYPWDLRENSSIVICTWLFVGNVQVELLWYVGIVRGGRGRTSWVQEREIRVI